MKPHLVFVGAGHAHLHPLSCVREFMNAGARVTLIAPGKFWYSGMGPGMISRFYEPADDTVDAQALVEAGGGTFIKDSVLRIDAAQRRLHLRGGAVVDYDLLSLNVGSEVPLEKIPGAAEFGLPVKPIKNLLRIREALTESNEAGTPRIVVLGGGAAGAEVGINLWHLLAQQKREARITIVQAGERLLQEATPRAAKKLAAYLDSLGIEVLTGVRSTGVTSGRVELGDGRALDFDHLLVAIGIRPPSLLRESGLPCGPDGSMRADECLRCTAHPEIYGAGDGIWFGEAGLPRIGVFAVRQGPVLHRNLLAALRGEAPEKFKPQKRYLLILNLGDGTGLLTYGWFTIRSRWAFWFKDWLDRRFVRQFQTAAR